MQLWFQYHAGKSIHEHLKEQFQIGKNIKMKVCEKASLNPCGGWEFEWRISCQKARYNALYFTTWNDLENNQFFVNDFSYQEKGDSIYYHVDLSISARLINKHEFAHLKNAKMVGDFVWPK
jgi:hypothetical protein